MNYTTIEQSKKLVKLRLNPDTADMFYFLDPTPAGCIYHLTVPQIGFGVKTREPEYNKGDIPCWSLGALINIIPSTIYKGKQTFTLEMHKDALYHLCYESRSRLNEIWVTKKHLLDAAFEMVVWLLENNYIEKGE